jgi:YesN/AraC family two-component response regulator
MSASDGDQALRAIDDGDVSALDLLVTDMVMPGRLNGRELADQVRRRIPRVKLLFISGYIDNPLVREAGFGPGEHWLQKPFSLATLMRKAREIIDAP